MRTASKQDRKRILEKHSRVTRHFDLRYLIFLAAAASLGGLLFGFDIAIITGAGRFLALHFNLSDLKTEDQP
jgi:hypothetical protein